MFDPCHESVSCKALASVQCTKSADFITRVLHKITMFGALYLSVVAIAPIITGNIVGYGSLAIGGTSVIIVVGVALETVKQMEAQMLMRHYKGFLE